jgi:hypothetical protein
MEGLSFVVCAMLIAFCVVFVSCGKEKDAPTIKFTYNGVVIDNGAEVEAKVGEKIPITVEYNVPGRLDHLFLWTDSIGYNEAHASGFDTKTTHKITTTIEYQRAVNTQIRTYVEDKQKNPLSANFELKIKVK